MSIQLIGEKGPQQIPGFGHKITWGSGIKSQDQAGSSSSSADSHQGYKPVLISISCKIRFGEIDEFANLAGIFNLTKDGEPFVYTIIHTELNAFGVVQAKFAEDIQISEDTTLKVFAISLKMKQVSSIPEKKEERESVPATTTPKQPTATTTVSANTPVIDLKSPELKGWVEKPLAKANEIAKGVLS